MTVALVRSISDLTNQIDQLIQNTSLRWWFRGHQSEAWELLPIVTMFLRFIAVPPRIAFAVVASSE
jgi:hypothetical protein